MAIAPTGDIYKALSFDNVSSRTYGVYITGSAVYNAPEREVEMISVPGRNGQFALDKGRFENIEVTYPAGIFADSETDFVDAISEFRNFLCSRKGYVRLQDEYNPNEYRMAIYKSGLEVEPAQLKAGEFEITFDCKPQRFLTSGETAVTVSSGGTLTNPTLFEAQPLLAVKGYGAMQVGGYNIELQNVALGSITLLASKRITGTSGKWGFPSSVVNSGNPEYLAKVEANALFQSSKILKSAEVTGTSGYVNISTEASVSDLNGYLTIAMNDIEYATADSSKNCSVTVTFTAQDDTTASVTFNFYAIYDRLPTSDYDTFEIKASQSASGFVSTALNSNITLTSSELTAVSTASALGNPSYIDCEMGEAYKRLGGRIFSLNSYVDLGSDLPVLSIGNTTITYDNTITEVKVTPRWWRV